MDTKQGKCICGIKGKTVKRYKCHDEIAIHADNCPQYSKALEDIREYLIGGSKKTSR